MTSNTECRRHHKLPSQIFQRSLTKVRTENHVKTPHTVEGAYQGLLEDLGLHWPKGLLLLPQVPPETIPLNFIGPDLIGGPFMKHPPLTKRCCDSSPRGDSSQSWRSKASRRLSRIGHAPLPTQPSRSQAIQHQLCPCIPIVYHIQTRGP